MICIADNPPRPGPGNVLTFTGRYRLAGPAPEDFPVGVLGE